MNKLPNIINVNATIRLEKISASHCESMFSQINRHREYLSNYVDWTRFNTKVEDSHQFVALCQQEAEQGDSFVWAICLKENTQTIGTISLNKPIDWQNRTALLGYWLSPEMQGKGIITQSVNTVIEETKHLFSDYILRCAIHNEKSNNVAKRCGFLYEGTKENAEKIGDKRYAQNIYRKSF